MTTTHPSRYLVALVDGGGTVPPELGAVRALVARGHDVTVLAEDSTEADVRATGATFRPWVQGLNRPDRAARARPLPRLGGDEPAAALRPAGRHAVRRAGPGYLADVQAAIDERRPDAVLCSQFAFGAMIGAEAAGVPFAVLMPNVYLLPCEGLPPLGLGFQPAQGPSGGCATGSSAACPGARSTAGASTASTPCGPSTAWPRWPRSGTRCTGRSASWS